MQQQSKLIKILSAIVKFVAKEFLWILLILIVSFPLAYLEMILLQSSKGKFQTFMEHKFPGNEFFIVLYIITLISLYFVHIVVGALKIVITPKSTPA